MAPGAVSNFQEVIGSLSVGVLAIALLVIANTHRDQIERTRQAEIRAAYDKTLEGWSRALEIRDKEIRGHATRVTDLTMVLARAFGFRGEQLEQIYRGALLHDIGKMSIPDSILFKPAALNAEEWAIMKTHPTIAVEMLSGISFVEPSLVIAACHHEWWDGSGYPRGLRGEEIPLEARIFAVVDVWDALLSERPYRQAWTKEATLRYLQEQRGSQFDPQVVDRFLYILNKNGG
jgi:putative nucleotidyltransferase with HDIG domain